MNNIKMAKGLEIKTNTERVTIENNIVSGSTEKCENLLDIKYNNNSTFTVNEDKSITINKDPTTFNIWFAGAYSYYVNKDISKSILTLQKGTYTFTGKMLLFALNDNLDMLPYEGTFTTNSTIYIIAVRLQANYSEVKQGDILYPMLVEGTTAPTTFIPIFTGLRYGYYKGLQLDKFSYIDKTNKIKHIGGASYTFTGNEVWTLSTTYSNNTFLCAWISLPIKSKLIKNNDRVNMACNSLPWGEYSLFNETTMYNMLGYNTNGDHAVCLRKSELSSLNSAGINEWLINHKTIIDFQLAKPSESGIEEF